MAEYYGRTVIYTNVEEIDQTNVLDVLSEALDVHDTNVSQMDYLYDYYKGKTPIQERTKTVRPDILNKICENRANEIVSFKTGYLVGEPIQYIASVSDSGVSAQITELNRLMVLEKKAQHDKQLVEWQNICGTAYRMVFPKNADDEDRAAFEDDDAAPFDLFTPDPRNVFVIYSAAIGNRPMACVHCGTDAEGNPLHTLYTRDTCFYITNKSEFKKEAYTLGFLPIIEYPANNARLGSFEVVLDLLDALNTLDSDRLDGIEQFIQSLIVLYNCTLPEGETGQSIRDMGIIELPSNGDVPADIKILAEQLDQSQTQTLKEDLWKMVLSIVGMPSQSDGSSSDSSNNGAVIYKQGWEHAEARAKDQETMFKGCERDFLKLVLRICQDLQGPNVKPSQVDVKFTRRHYEDILAKSQVLTTMLSNEKIAPQLAFTHCGLFTDAEEAYQASMKWYQENRTAGAAIEEPQDEESAAV